MGAPCPHAGSPDTARASGVPVPPRFCDTERSCAFSSCCLWSPPVGAEHVADPARGPRAPTTAPSSPTLWTAQRSPLRVRREDVVFRLHYRVACGPALGVALLYGCVGRECAG